MIFLFNWVLLRFQPLIFKVCIQQPDLKKTHFLEDVPIGPFNRLVMSECLYVFFYENLRACDHIHRREENWCLCHGHLPRGSPGCQSKMLQRHHLAKLLY